LERGESQERRPRSRRSRERIIQAAAVAFAEQGYLATTIDGIAQAAGVAVQTVYYVFGTKRNVLSAVLDASIAGDLASVPIADRDWVGQLSRLTDRDAAFDLLVEQCVSILARTAPIYDVVSRAAADPDVSTIFADNRRHRRVDQRGLVESLGHNGHLRAGLDIDTAADIFYAIVSEDVYLMLVNECGWSRDRFRDWMAATLRQQLAADS
jgi:AcrR family transcriptional regulator